MNDQLKELSFLLGKWKGKAEDQFGEKGVIESTSSFNQDPNEKFISGRTESWKDGKLVNSSHSFLIWDPNIFKYVQKSVFSYGWVNNEVGELNGDRLLFDILSIDGEPSFFKGVKWRSFIHRYSEKEIGSGLEVAKGGEPFHLYGETRARRV